MGETDRWTGAARGGKGCGPTAGFPLWGRGPPRKFLDNFQGCGPPPLTRVPHPFPGIPAPFVPALLAGVSLCLVENKALNFGPLDGLGPGLWHWGLPQLPPPPPGWPPSLFTKFQRGKASKQKDVGEETRDRRMMRN